MATIQKFEGLVCWQKARELANFVLDIVEKPQFKNYSLKNQMSRAGTSPMLNIAEGFDRGTRNELIDALYIAKGETGEVRSQLYLASDRRYIDISKFREGMQLTDECSRLIQSFAEKVKGGSARGTQFKTAEQNDDFLKELAKKSAPEAYERLYRKEGK